MLGARGSTRVELYDASIYIDDLEKSDAEAVDLFREEVQSGLEHGYRNFKIKVGRGARWMELHEGLQRDLLVVETVREAAGPEAKILADANMGNTLNTARQFLSGCVDQRLFWFEEPFAEDPPLNEALKDFIVEQGWETLVADGEHLSPPGFFDMVEQGYIDVVQHGFREYGLTWWIKTAARLEPWNVLCAPHSWGSVIERYAHAHFAASIPNYALLEAAPAEMPGFVLDGWEMQEGCLIVPDTPGTGFDVEPAVFEEARRHPEAFTVTA